MIAASPDRACARASACAHMRFIGSQQARVPFLDDRRYLSITQLSNVEVTLDSLPQENIARSLHEPLAQDYALAVIRIYALARKRFQHRGSVVLRRDPQQAHKAARVVSSEPNPQRCAVRLTGVILRADAVPPPP